LTAGSIMASSIGGPSYVFSGGLGTGIGSPATDILSLYSSGNEQIRIDTAGKVGIGTTNPSGKLEVHTSSALGTGTITGGGTVITGAGTVFTTQLFVGSRIISGGEARTVVVIGSNLSLTLDSAFTVNPGGTPFNYTNPSLFVGSSNYVGMGTTSPSAPLHVYKFSGATMRLDADSVSKLEFYRGGSKAGQIFGASSNIMRMQSGSSGPLVEVSTSYISIDTGAFVQNWRLAGTSDGPGGPSTAEIIPALV